jgi:hypothetical protein
MKGVVHCKREAFDVYIGRGRGECGRWGNPFRIGPDGTREQVIAKYRAWLWGEIASGAIALEDLAALSGKVLGCWCSPSPCHGEVLAAAADWAKRVLESGDRSWREFGSLPC